MRPGASVRPLLCRKGRGGAGTRQPSIAAAKLKKLERNPISVVMIRLARVGAPKQPYYRIVVIEKDRARNGRSIEVVGTYNPRTNPASVDLKYERIAYWRGKGAKLSPSWKSWWPRTRQACGTGPESGPGTGPGASPRPGRGLIS